MLEPIKEGESYIRLIDDLYLLIRVIMYVN